jgi:hypothetical protein
MTLPEFLDAASRSRHVEHEPATDWVHRLTSPRTAQSYLRDQIEQVKDPTGLPGRAFEKAVVDIESRCSTAAAVIARLLGRSTSLDG